MAGAAILRPAVGLPIEISVSISETHESASTITEYPIDAGSAISDHVQDSGAGLVLTSIIDASSPEFTPSLAYDQLVQLKRSKEPFTVITVLRVYRDMLFRRLSCTRDRETGSVLAFTADLKQIRFAAAGTVEMTPEASGKGGGKTKDLGQKGTKDAPEDAAAKARKSLADKGLDKVGGAQRVVELFGG